MRGRNVRRRTQERSVRAAVWDKTAGRCWYCPRVSGGNDGVDNLVPACSACNGRKGAMAAERWRSVAFRGLAFWGETMSAYTITAGQRPKERLNLTTLLDGYRAELERLAGVVGQQIAWLDANIDDELYTPRQKIWETRWSELNALRGTFQDRLIEAELYVEKYLWIDINSGLYDRWQADEEVARLEDSRAWWDESPIREMSQYGHPEYGPCPY